MQKPQRGGRPPIPGGLGRLEKSVMATLWGGESLSVRAVRERLGSPSRAYTTIMTTLDRLHGKGLLERIRSGNAYVYCVAKSRDEHHRELAERLAQELIPSGGEAALAGFVEQAARIDEANLDRLEQLIAQRRKQAGAS